MFAVPADAHDPKAHTQQAGETQERTGVDIPDDRKYTKEHEWALADGDVVTVGITEFAQDQLGDVVFVDLPDEGGEVTQLEKMGEIESVKAVSDLYSPVTGRVVKVNDGLAKSPEIVNEDPHGAGWLIQVELADASELDGLMSAEAYEALIS